MACKNCQAESGCGCVSNLKEIKLGTKTVWTLGGTGAQGVAVIFGSERGLAISPTIVMQQGTLTVADASSGFKGIAGYQVSADGITWDAFVSAEQNAQNFLAIANVTLAVSIIIR